MHRPGSLIGGFAIRLAISPCGQMGRAIANHLDRQPVPTPLLTKHAHNHHDDECEHANSKQNITGALIQKCCGDCEQKNNTKESSEESQKGTPIGLSEYAQRIAALLFRDQIGGCGWRFAIKVAALNGFKFFGKNPSIQIIRKHRTKPLRKDFPTWLRSWQVQSTMPSMRFPLRHATKFAAPIERLTCCYLGENESHSRMLASLRKPLSKKNNRTKVTEFKTPFCVTPASRSSPAPSPPKKHSPG